MYLISTENSTDMPASFFKENNVGCLNLTTILDGKVYGHGEEMDPKEFFQKMREGAKPTTSQVNPEEAKAFFESQLDKYDGILHIGFDSGISGTVGSIAIGAREVMEKHPDKKIVVIDTLCATLGQGILVQHAVKMRDAGASMEEVEQWVRDNMMHMTTVFTVDNLFDLWRGGRVKKSVAVIGSLASVKPVLFVDNDGTLQPITNVRGRKKSLLYMVDYMEQHMGSKKDMNKDMIAIAHGDCIEDAEFVRDEIKRRFGFENFMIHNLGTVIGSHTGPTIVVLNYFGDSRR